MNVLILNTQVPFCRGGAEVLAEDLEQNLRLAGHNAEILTLPFKWYPQQTLVNTLLVSKLMDISSFNGMNIDRVIALKFPLWLIPHPQMSLWILHQHRAAYDLWESDYSDLVAMPDGEAVRNLIRREDSIALRNRERIYTISANVSSRLKRYNGIESGVLYPPPRAMAEFHVNGYEDYFFFPSRITPIKRQALIIEALPLVPESVRVVFAGDPDSPQYLEKLQTRATQLGVEHKIQWLGRISEQEKFDLYAKALMVIFPPLDEDYGYVAPEAMLSSKAVLTLEDSGGAAEFVIHEETGLIVPSQSEAVAQAMSRVWQDRKMAVQMGGKAHAHITAVDLSWEKVIASLL
ncbi:MAG: glycosyltransferase family 4 protein [Halieaceae bacterium]|jgi:glycosyltransferase involved in cell wall biosynthesis|nr:glycosyltransferase family 4 protein [Halieaceae bacterium]